MAGTHPNLKIVPSSNTASRLLLLLCGILALARPSHANTYMFSFTASQLMTALQTSVGTSTYQESAYYAIFVQPLSSQISSFTITSATTPNPTDPNVWDASVINDPSAPALGYGPGPLQCASDCTWAGFYKDSSYTGSYPTATPTHSGATVISGANNPGTNIFLGHSFYDEGLSPYGWSGENLSNQILFQQVINAVMPGTDVFTLSLTTNQVLSGSYTFQGSASALVSGSPTSMTSDTKDDAGFTFQLTMTAVGTPEPDTAALILGGALLMLPLFRRRFRKSSSSHGKPGPVTNPTREDRSVC
jgi:hypothetical protein